MKVSVSLPDEDLAFLDDYAREHGIDSRSAAVHQAVRALRAAQLAPAYAEAFQEWDGGTDAGLWDSTTTDGLRGRD